MQLTITLPDILPDQIARVMRKVREFFAQEGIPVEIKPDVKPDESEGDSWDNLRIEDIAVDTGKTDFAENHDHYLYGTPKR
jgi:hypothetical protein